MKKKIFKGIILFWCFFIGIGAVGGALAMFVDPMGVNTGMSGFFTGLNKLPFANIFFKNLIFPGIALFLINGVTNLTAAVLIIKEKRAGYLTGWIFGITLMLWITIQFTIFDPNIMDTMYFIFGLLQFITGYAAYVFYMESKYRFNAAEYQNIGKEHKILVVYFSRLGATRKAAYEYADKLKADISEITVKERIKGFTGFMNCGRYGLMKAEMPSEINADLNKYSEIIVFSPTWVFQFSASVKYFLKTYGKKCNITEFHLLHFILSDLSGAFKQLNKYVDVSSSSFYTCVARFGKLRKIKKIK